MTYYNVFKNGEFQGTTTGLNLKACKLYIKHVLFSTHMGEWRRTLTLHPSNPKRTCYEYEYSTTIGVYFRFSPSRKWEGV